MQRLSIFCKELKSLPKQVRKEKKVEAARNKSPSAKILKLADKTSNVRAVGTSPAKDWSIKRRLEYIAWAQSVVDGLRGASDSLEEKFDRASEVTIGKIKSQLNQDRRKELLLGWQIYISINREGKQETIAVWKSGLSGSGWIRKLVEKGQAADLGGNGYPDRYSARAKYLFQEMLSHEPTDANNKTMPAYDRTIIRHDLIKKLDPEEVLEIEFWDQS